MQIHLSFTGDNGSPIVLPIAYHAAIQGLIYRAAFANPVYSTFLHNEGYASGIKKYKLFTFGPLTGYYRVQEKSITFPRGASLEIRSMDPLLTQTLLTAFPIGSECRLEQNTLRVAECALSDVRLHGSRYLIETISPVCAYTTDETGYKEYISPEDPEFFRLVCANARRKWASLYPEEETEGITLEPVPGYVYKKRVTRFKMSPVIAWEGRFVLNGSPALIDFLYNTGLGSTNSQGFGMFRIV